MLSAFIVHPARKPGFPLAFVTALLLLSQAAYTQVIYTVAGSNFGDGGPATNATFKGLAGITSDASGVVYVADLYTNSVRKIGVNGIVTTIAGVGQYGYSGDYGSATKAKLNNPASLAMDASGSLYIDDQGNNVIRRVNAKGQITTVAGNGIQGFSGDGKLATQAGLNLPGGIALDMAGNLFISDTFNERIRKVGSNGIITTVAGDGRTGFAGDGSQAKNAELSLPGGGGIAVDGAGNLFIADTGNNRIRKIAPTGIITTVAGNGDAGFAGDGGSAVDANLDAPDNVFVDGNGNLYISDGWNERIRKVDADGVISTFAGNGDSGYSGDGGAATNAALKYPAAMTMGPSGNLYISDAGNLVVREVNSEGTITTFAGNCCSRGDGDSATLASLDYPVAAVMDVFGNLFIADLYDEKVRKIGIDGVISTVAGSGEAGYSGDGGPAVAAKLNGPSGLALDAFGNLYIADSGNSVVRKVGSNGVITTVVGNGHHGYAGDGSAAKDAELSQPAGITIDALGNLYIADTYNNVVREVSGAGVISTIAGTGIPGFSGFGAATNVELHLPTAVAWSPQGTLYIADSANGRICSVSNGIIGTVAGNGGSELGEGGPAVSANIGFPTGVAVDASGNLYIADPSGSRIRKVDSDGIITTVAGYGSTGFFGDGQSAVIAKLNEPFGVTVTASGNLYIADSGNGRVREVALAQNRLLTNLDQYGLTGSWYNPATSGQGFEFEIFPDVVSAGQGILFAGWFTYDVSAAGGRRWYALQGNVSNVGPDATLSIFAVTGGNLNAPPALSSGPVLGHALIEFSDCDDARLTYRFTDGIGRSGTIPLRRLTPNVTCSSDGGTGATVSDYLLSGNWYDPTTSGQGFMFDINPSINNFFAAWYTFKPNGEKIGGSASQDWYILQSAQFKPGTNSLGDIPIIETVGGIFNDPASVSSTQVGVADILFSSCGEMVLAYSFTRGEAAGQSGRIDLVHAGITPQSCGF
jgi:sugar lactone lactonase YvrE